MRPQFLLLLIATATLSADQSSSLAPQGFAPGATPLFSDEGAVPTEGMISNSVTQLKVVSQAGEDVLYGANSFGLLRSFDLGESIETITDSCGIGRGGVSGLDANEWMVAAATVIDTSIANVQGAGMGVAFSLDRGNSWTWLEQPMDMVADTAGVPSREWVAIDCVTGDSLDWMIETPVVTSIENITWGLACEGDSALWAASFAGGFRRYSLATECWELHVVNDVPFAPAKDEIQIYHNQRGFSVLASNNGIWAGSAGGLDFLSWDDLHNNPDYDRLGGWTHFDYQHPQPSGEPTITGNWVVSMARRELADGSDQVWVGGWATFASVGDYFGLSWTGDDGDTWTVVHDLENVKIWDIAFDGPDIYVASSDGLWKSNNHGIDGSWNRFSRLRDTNTGRDQLVDDVYSVAVADGRLLVGASRGLFISEDGGNSWSSQYHEPLNLIAFPNPFSPNAHERAVFSVKAERTGTVTIELFDFAMDLVKVVADGESVNSGVSREFYWDGTNRAGEEVANGVYFYRVDAPGASRWGKLMVVK